ncbi:TPA: hypothetical protein ACH3X2_007887 [Trebouxia sp. C0005]
MSHDIFVACRQHTRHQFSLCLGCLVDCLKLFCVHQIRTHSQETLYPSLLIYNVLDRDETVTDHVSVVPTDSAWLTGSIVFANADQVLTSLSKKRSGDIVLI